MWRIFFAVHGGWGRLGQGGCRVGLGNGWWRDCAGGVTGWEGLGQLWGVAVGVHVGPGPAATFPPPSRVLIHILLSLLAGLFLHLLSAPCSLRVPVAQMPVMPAFEHISTM